MRNLSCFKCSFHRCVNHNYCTLNGCELKEGYFYNANNKIVKESIRHPSDNFKQVENNAVSDEKAMSFEESLVLLA